MRAFCLSYIYIYTYPLFFFFVASERFRSGYLRYIHRVTTAESLGELSMWDHQSNKSIEVNVIALPCVLSFFECGCF